MSSKALGRVGRWIVALALSMAVFSVAMAGVRNGGAQSGGGGPSAGFGERIAAFSADITVRESGNLFVRETIVYDFGFQQRHGILRSIPVSFRYDDEHDRVTPLNVLSVTTPDSGASADFSLEGDGVRTIRIGDPDETIGGVHTYQIEYTVDGALNGFDDHDELFWNVTGNGWDVPIDSVTATVTTPSSITQVGCFAGFEGSQLGCDTSSVFGTAARFGDSGLTSGEGLTVVVGFEPGAVATTEPILEERWTITKAFSLTPVTVGVTGVLLIVVLVLVGRLLWTVGRDRRLRGDAVATAFATDADVTLVGDEPVPAGTGELIPVEFTPPDGLRPGLVGTLVDEMAHPLDVTATIVDLAVRGYLRIEETQSSGLFRRADWKLSRLPDPADDDGLLAYEASLLSGLFEDGVEVQLSDLKRKFAERMRKVQTKLYEEMVERGWYRRRPDHTRLLWLLAGIGLLAVGVGLTVVAAVFTTWGLVPVPIAIGGIVLVIGSHWAPARTAKGTGVLRRTLGFRRFIEESEARRAEFAERANLFTEYLPYAVVFGSTDKWANAFEGLDAEAVQSWYVGTGAFHVQSFSSDLESFSTSAAGTLSASASSGSSGFSGGGGGGGFGGGGGGSW